MPDVRAPRIMIVAGSDSGGGAGIQADIKTVSALGGYASTAITALTAQDTHGVHAALAVPAEFVAAQIGTVLGDLGTDAVKIGMLGDAELVEAVADALAGCPAPLVLDPVMVAKGGARLLPEASIAALLRRLVPNATLLTPNLPEAAALIGRPVGTLSEMRAAIPALLDLGSGAVLLKGGHLPGGTVVDMLAAEEWVEEFHASRIETRNTHGTGCTLASAIAVELGRGADLRAAVVTARTYLRAAIEAAPGFGGGHGPLGHWAWRTKGKS